MNTVVSNKKYTDQGQQQDSRIVREFASEYLMLQYISDLKKGGIRSYNIVYFDEHHIRVTYRRI